MIKYEIVEHLATIKDWGLTTLELNIVKWGDNQEKYDLRRWERNIPGRGITLTKEDMEKLFWAINDELDLIELIEDGPQDTPSKKEIVSIESEKPVETYGEIDFRSFFVHGDGNCYIKGHDDQEDVIAVIDLLRNDMTIEKVEIPAVFCLKCNAYYISEDDYLRVASRGRLMCQLMSDDEYEEYKASLSDFEHLNPESKLKSLGYTVNSKDNYSDKYRQQILSFAIESGVVTQKEAIKHLSFLIHLFESNSNNRQAIAKWHRDRDFLTNYKSSGKRRVGSKRIVIDPENFWELPFN